ncbi:Hypothetical predicted protein, partial [Pelobates cultripes]
VKQGGVGLPNINQYYKAAALTAGITLHSPKGDISWVDMENAQLKTLNIVDVLWTPKHLRVPKLDLFHSTSLTLRTWDTFMATMGCKLSFHPRAPLTALRTASPDLPLTRWTKAGITNIQHLVDNKGVIAFADIQAKWHLPMREVFTYLRLKGTILAHVNLHNNTREQSLVAGGILDRCWAAPNKPKAISLCYKMWETTLPQHTPLCKTKWEEDCSLQLSEDDW